MPASVKVRRSPPGLLVEDHHRVSGLVQRVLTGEIAVVCRGVCLITSASDHRKTSADKHLPAPARDNTGGIEIVKERASPK
jgi:hypothetical protein